MIGKGVAALADELAAYKLDEVLLVEHELLENYTPDGYRDRAHASDRISASPIWCSSRTRIKCAISRPSWPRRSARE